MLGVGINLLTLAIRKIAGALGFYPKTIDQSLRFNDDDSAYLSRTPSVAGNRKTWTWSGWVKRGSFEFSGATLYGNNFFSASNGTTVANIKFLPAGNLSFHDYTGSGYRARYETYALFRDPSAWYHVVLAVDTTQAVSTDRVKIYVNGELQALQEYVAIAQNTDTYINEAITHMMGRDARTTIGIYIDPYEGYLADVHFTDGTAYTADDFGEFKSGVWVAKTPSVTYGTNGFYLKFANSGALGTDSSGNGNTWTPTNLAATDVMLDSPTNNFATLNPIDQLTATALSEGNLKQTSLSTNCLAKATIAVPSSGKYYYENNINATGGYTYIGITGASTYSFQYNRLGSVSVDGSLVTTVAGFAAGDVIGIGLDCDTPSVSVYKNGTLLTTQSAPNIVGNILDWYQQTSCVMTQNFGQDSSFAGTKTPQGNTDANGIGDFYYAPPTGYLALCTANLPEPAISPLNDASPSDYFNTVLYTGNGTSQSINVGFATDFTWIKDRTGTDSHHLFDRIRGTNQRLVSQVTNAENTEIDCFNSFDANGFSIGANPGVNASGDAHVAWNWKANGTGVSNTDGTITSTVSANVDSGFSIVSYTSQASGTATVGHGLNQQPEMIITKSRASGSAHWATYHASLGVDYGIFLNLTNAASLGVGTFWTSSMSDSVIGLGNWHAGIGDTIAYCFHSVEGYSKVGSYVGNGSSDGVYVHCGFSPSLVLIKRTDNVGNWQTYDDARDTYNTHEHVLFPNLSNAEGVSSGYALDTLSNGFKLRSTDSDRNANGGTYIYMAFAEMPFKYSTGR